MRKISTVGKTVEIVVDKEDAKDEGPDRPVVDLIRGGCVGMPSRDELMSRGQTLDIRLVGCRPVGTGKVALTAEISVAGPENDGDDARDSPHSKTWEALLRSVRGTLRLARRALVDRLRR